MKELFKQQLEGNIPINEETLKKFNKKEYFNGEPIKIGDVVLFALLVDYDEMQIDDINLCDVPISEPITRKDYSEIKMTIITLNETHFNMFKYDSKYVCRDGIPTIMLLK